MSSVVISGDTSGSITLQAPAVSGSSVLTLPATTATLATLTTPSFGTTIGVGGATASASGSGITFPATQSASSDANTLDDYEEGTWTPVVARTGSNYTQTALTGTYTKIGRQVTCQCYTNVTTVTTQGSSYVTVTGLPFAANSSTNYNYVGSVFYNNICTTTPVMSVAVFAGSSFVYLHGTNRDDNPLNENVSVNGYIHFTITYFTS